jgi:hypothetical protein
VGSIPTRFRHSSPWNQRATSFHPLNRARPPLDERPRRPPRAVAMVESRLSISTSFE